MSDPSTGCFTTLHEVPVVDGDGEDFTVRIGIQCQYCRYVYVGEAAFVAKKHHECYGGGIRGDVPSGDGGRRTPRGGSE